MSENTNWGSKIRISVYVEGADIDSAHSIDVASNVSNYLKGCGYKVDFVGVTKSDVRDKPTDQIAS